MKINVSKTKSLDKCTYTEIYFIHVNLKFNITRNARTSDVITGPSVLGRQGTVYDHIFGI